jgi:hypothetical protein
VWGKIVKKCSEVNCGEDVKITISVVKWNERNVIVKCE